MRKEYLNINHSTLLLYLLRQNDISNEYLETDDGEDGEADKDNDGDEDGSDSFNPVWEDDTSYGQAEHGYADNLHTQGVMITIMLSLQRFPL